MDLIERYRNYLRSRDLVNLRRIAPLLAEIDEIEEKDLLLEEVVSYSDIDMLNISLAMNANPYLAFLAAISLENIDMVDILIEDLDISDGEKLEILQNSSPSMRNHLINTDMFRPIYPIYLLHRKEYDRAERYRRSLSLEEQSSINGEYVFLLIEDGIMPPEELYSDTMISDALSVGRLNMVSIFLDMGFNPSMGDVRKIFSHRYEQYTKPYQEELAIRMFELSLYPREREDNYLETVSQWSDRLQEYLA